MAANERQQRLADGGQSAAIWRPRRCQWIEGAPNHREDCKCLQPVQDGWPYCPDHVERVRHRPEKAKTDG